MGLAECSHNTVFWFASACYFTYIHVFNDASEFFLQEKHNLWYNICTFPVTVLVTLSGFPQALENFENAWSVLKHSFFRILKAQKSFKIMNMVASSLGPGCFGVPPTCFGSCNHEKKFLHQILLALTLNASGNGVFTKKGKVHQKVIDTCSQKLYKL